jgi:hypothetical protein
LAGSSHEEWTSVGIEELGATVQTQQRHQYTANDKQAASELAPYCHVTYIKNLNLTIQARRIGKGLVTIGTLVHRALEWLSTDAAALSWLVTTVEVTVYE